MTKKFSLLFSFSMIFVSGSLLFHSLTVAHTPLSVATAYTNMFFPRIVLSLWLILAVIMTVNIWISQAGTPKQYNWKSLLKAIGALVLVCLLLQYAGFIPACIIFCFLYPVCLGYRNFRVLLPVSLLYTVLLWFLFNKVLLMSLPEIPWL